MGLGLEKPICFLNFHKLPWRHEVKLRLLVLPAPPFLLGAHFVMWLCGGKPVKAKKKNCTWYVAMFWLVSEHGWRAKSGERARALGSPPNESCQQDKGHKVLRWAGRRCPTHQPCLCPASWEALPADAMDT